VYRVRDVAPGELRVRVQHPDFADEEATLRVDSTGRADRPFTLPDLDLSEAGEVEGDVLDERGDRVAGARVMAGEGAGYTPSGRPARGVVTSDSDGHFVLAGVHPGTATITAISATAGRGSARSVEVSSGRTTRGVRIQLGPHPGDGESVAPGGVAIGLGERGSAPTVEVVIVSVAEASEAERAGLEPGDVISAGRRAAELDARRARPPERPARQ
jgi:hypothetical protein